MLMPGHKEVVVAVDGQQLVVMPGHKVEVAVDGQAQVEMDGQALEAVVAVHGLQLVVPDGIKSIN